MVAFKDFAMLPISVDIPVAMTIAFARPLETVEEEKARLIRSPTGQSGCNVTEGDFETGRDSPVRRASSVSKFMHSMMRTSAGTVSPIFNYVHQHKSWGKMEEVPRSDHQEPIQEMESF